MFLSIVALEESNIVSILTRTHNDKRSNIIYEILNVPRPTDISNRAPLVKEYNSKELMIILEIFANYRSYKEIDFFKHCLAHLVGNLEVKNLRFNFHYYN